MNTHLFRWLLGLGLLLTLTGLVGVRLAPAPLNLLLDNLHWSAAFASCALMASVRSGPMFLAKGPAASMPDPSSASRQKI